MISTARRRKGREDEDKEQEEERRETRPGERSKEGGLNNSYEHAGTCEGQNMRKPKPRQVVLQI